MVTTEKKQKLRSKLRDIWDHDDFVMGVSGGLQSDEQIELLLGYIDAWEADPPKDPDRILASDISAATVLIRHGDIDWMYE